MLQPLGISAEAEAVYIVLAPLNSATVTEIADVGCLRPEETAKHLGELKDLKLVAELSPGTWQALPLHTVLGDLKAQRQRELELAVVAAESLQSHLLAASQSQAETDVRVVVGPEAILAARRQICDEAKKTLCLFDKPPHVQARPNPGVEVLSQTAPEWQALDRGVSVRCVYQPGFDADRLAELLLFAQKGEQARTAPVPMKLVMADAQVALIPSMRSYDAGHEVRATITQHPMLVEALQFLFDAVWEASVPITAANFADSDPRRQMLTSLLMTGTTDNAIANHLGINVRSVRRWISDLMDELGATTRLQLGAALVRSDRLRGSRPRPRRSP